VDDPAISQTELSQAVDRVREGIAAACDRSGRTAESVTLVAVTKSFPVEVVQTAAALGLEDFGENHAGELAAKSAMVRARWHFIGKLQAGTAPRVADHADVIHSGEPGRGLARVAHRAARAGPRIPCLAQVDFTGQRQGIAPDDLERAVQDMSELDGIELVGLMTLPPWTEDLAATRAFFRRLRELRDRLRTDHPAIVDLSMGMSHDYEVAVEEGATMVRVGTALFGVRPRGRPVPRVEG
jgi:pyridoxal phosphate enzyme (YggS family)